MKFKGPLFPSYKNPGDGRRMVRVYEGRPVGIDKQMRYLRVVCKHIIDSKDPRVIAAGNRVIDMVMDEPHPEYSALHLYAAGVRMATDTGEQWFDCMNTIVDKFEANEAADEVRVDPRKIGASNAHVEAREEDSILRRLLRALVPRALRKGDATSAVLSEPGQADVTALTQGQD